MELNRIYTGDARVLLKDFPSKLVNVIVTSPPYYGLRDYGTAKWEGGDENCDHKDEPMRTRAYVNQNTSGFNDVKNSKNHQFFKSICGKCGAIHIDSQIGLEASPEQYIETMVGVFRECKRVLRDDGTLWLNIGDSYAGSGRGANENGKQGTNKGTIFNPETSGKTFGLKPKDLIGIPWMLAFALRSDGWYLRQDIIWHKPNPMPESVTDRCTKSHEYIFLLSKSAKYYYNADAIKEITTGYDGRKDIVFKEASGGDIYASGKTHERWKKRKNDGTNHGGNGNGFKNHSGYDQLENPFVRNKRSVWTVPTMPYKEAHFATFPEDLIVDCIKAGCPEGGIVLDPFMGAGTTALVAAKLNRNFIGIELNPDYVKLSERRLQSQLGMFHPQNL